MVESYKPQSKRQKTEPSEKAAPAKKTAKDNLKAKEAQDNELKNAEPAELVPDHITYSKDKATMTRFSGRQPENKRQNKRYAYRAEYGTTTKAISGWDFTELKECAAKRFNIEVESFNLVMKVIGNENCEYEIIDQEEFDDTLEVKQGNP